MLRCMARKLRVQFPGAIYHIMSRGDRREDIFRDDNDRESFLQTLADACAKTSWEVHAFCLMPNHFHLVVETPQPNLAAGMKWFLGTYTARFNRRHNLNGHVFAGRYKSVLVGGKGGYLRTVCDYVHLNPVRARLISPTDALRCYRWSSLPLYVTADRPAWLRVDRVFEECVISKDSFAGRKKFEQRLETRRSQESPDEFQAVRKAWCFGDEEFRRELLERVGEGAGAFHYGQEIQEAAEAKACRIIDEELSRCVWKEADLTLRRKGDPVKISIARRLRAETTVTLGWIANRLHMGTRTHLSHLLYWGRRREKQAGTLKETPTALRFEFPKREGKAGLERRARQREVLPIQASRSTVEDGNGSIPLADPNGVWGFDTSFD